MSNDKINENEIKQDVYDLINENDLNKFSIFSNINDKYWVLEKNKDGEYEPSYKITNCVITDFIKEIEPNRLIPDNYIIRWSRGQEFIGNKAQIIKDLTNSDIFHKRDIITVFVDKLFSSLRYKTVDNIKGTYLNQANIPEFRIDTEKLNKGVDLYNSIVEFVPEIQKEYIKSLWLVPVHYILKTNAPIARGVIYLVVTNGESGALKTTIVNIHKVMFELEYEPPKLEDVKPLDSFPSIRNELSSQGGYIILDEMDGVLIEGDHFNNKIRNLNKNILKIYLPNTANNDKQGENTDYHYLGTPIINLNSDIVLEHAEKERVLFFNMDTPCDLKKLKVLTKKDYDYLKEIGRAFWNTVRELDFSCITSELEARQLILDSMEAKYNISFNTILKLPIHESENENGLQEKLIKNIQFHCDISYSDIQGYLFSKKRIENFDWAWKTQKGKLNIYGKLFHQYLEKLIDDNTSNVINKLQDIGFPEYKKVAWYTGSKKGYQFDSVNEFLDCIGFDKYLRG